MAAVGEAVTLLKELREEVSTVTELSRELLGRLRDGKLRTDKGISLLGVRAAAILNYVTDLGLVLRAKSGGRSLREEPALPRILESRVVLEKLRPLEQRIRYQVDKLIRADGTTGSSDPLSFRPAPSNLTQEAEDEAEAEGNEAPKSLMGQNRYVPPRLVPVPYAPDASSPHSRALQAARRRALSSALLKELRDEMGDGPEHVGGSQPHSQQQSRTALEESFLFRLSESRHQRALRRRQSMGRSMGQSMGQEPPLNSITNFGAFSALLETTDQEAPPPPVKKRKKMGKKKGKKKGFRRRR